MTGLNQFWLNVTKMQKGKQILSYFSFILGLLGILAVLASSGCLPISFTKKQLTPSADGKIKVTIPSKALSYAIVVGFNSQDNMDDDSIAFYDAFNSLIKNVRVSDGEPVNWLDGKAGYGVRVLNLSEDEIKKMKSGILLIHTSVDNTDLSVWECYTKSGL